MLIRARQSFLILYAFHIIPYRTGAMENVRSMLCLIVEEFNLNQNTPAQRKTSFSGSAESQTTVKVCRCQHAVQNRTELYGTVQYGTVQCSAVQHRSFFPLFLFLLSNCFDLFFFFNSLNKMATHHTFSCHSLATHDIFVTLN